MKHLVKALIVSVGLISGSTAIASTPTQQLGQCLVDTLNGKERKNLAKGIYFAIGSHPEIKSFMNASPDTIRESDQYVGKLVTRLLTEDCPNELNAANKSDPLTIQKAFELVGQVAMQELMTNQQTMQAITNYAQYADQANINAVINK